MEAPISLKATVGNRTLRKAGTYVQSNQAHTSLTVNPKHQDTLLKHRNPLLPKPSTVTAKPLLIRRDTLNAYNPNEFKSPGVVVERGKMVRRSESREKTAHTDRTPTRDLGLRQERYNDGTVKITMKQSNEQSSEEKTSVDVFAVKSKLKRLPSLGDLSKSNGINSK